MSNTDPRPDVILPGYELIEKIGSGGYGEVWSAQAPGGLRKAVKYIFGDQFDKRATSELHALERIKTVRHPFLLSLERIEIVDGRLIVVCELADGSVRDRFEECQQQGLPGIPREELIGYLSDAAEALDYISRTEDLAHLDIKPENLLLVAGHVKVADFGLVKSLNNQTQASCVGGMTPTYAAPEVFRGIPSRQSDQYSLAILFQEMLCSTLPFNGANAAELTLQHMNGTPDLDRLSEGDRFAVSRALSKEADNRFDSCSDFIQALRDSGKATTEFSNVEKPAVTLTSGGSRRSSEQLSLQAPVSESLTEVFGGPDEAASAAVADSHVSYPDALANPTPKEAEPTLEVPFDSEYEPGRAVFIGVGSSGARVLRALRAQVETRLGTELGSQAAPMLLFDTDSQTLAQATRSETGNSGLKASETVALPLRRPQAYRQKADLLLRWLGRRWLYNIPKSLRTEGIRPLGRLALADHARQAFQRLRQVLLGATQSETSGDASDDSVSGEASKPLRVYFVASSAGAAGSGMTLDLAYAVRSIMDRLDLNEAKLFGILTHSTVRDATRCELAKVNSYAWLSEFDYLRKCDQGYPGDASIGLPAHKQGIAAFDHTYFIPLGDRIDTPVFDSGIDSIAEYLFADAFTPHQQTLDACRDKGPDAHAGGLRSIAVCHHDPDALPNLGAVEQAAIKRMIDLWIGGADAEQGEQQAKTIDSTDQVVQGAVAFLGKTQLDSSTIASNCRSLIEASLGGDATAYAEAWLSSCGNSREAIEARISQCFEVRADTDLPTLVDGRQIEEIVSPIIGKLANEVCVWVLSKVNRPQERIDGADRAVGWMRDYLTAVRSDLKSVAANLYSDYRTRFAEVPANGLIQNHGLPLFRVRLDQAALVAADQIVAELTRYLEQLSAELKNLRAVAVELKSNLVDPELCAQAPSGEAADFAVSLERRLQEDYLTSHDGLLGALAEPTAVTILTKTVAYAAAKCLRERTSASRNSAAEGFEEAYAEPPITDSGGEFWRLKLDLPAGGEQQSDSLLITELADLSLPHVAAGVISGRRDYAAFAERVRTRRDIPWVDAIRGSSASLDPVVSAESLPTSQPAVTAVLS